MARHEQDRENLLAEARNLVERAALRLAGYDEEVFVGFRESGGASFYFGPARAYHFTSDGRLRRAFVGEQLYKAEARRLVSLRRRRTSAKVELVRHVLDDDQQRAFLDEMRRYLDELRAALNNDRALLVGQVPADATVLKRVGRWLDWAAENFAVARSPRDG